MANWRPHGSHCLLYIASYTESLGLRGRWQRLEDGYPLGGSMTLADKIVMRDSGIGSPRQPQSPDEAVDADWIKAGSPNCRTMVLAKVKWSPSLLARTSNKKGKHALGNSELLRHYKLVIPRSTKFLNSSEGNLIERYADFVCRAPHHATRMCGLVSQQEQFKLVGYTQRAGDPQPRTAI